MSGVVRLLERPLLNDVDELVVSTNNVIKRYGFLEILGELFPRTLDHLEKDVVVEFPGKMEKLLGHQIGKREDAYNL